MSSVPSGGKSPPSPDISISVLVPTYNRRAALLTCLEHLENQTCPHFEVVIVDDGSSDDTRRAVERYRAGTRLRIRYVRQENQGPARARNLGISLAESPLCLLIGDDIFAGPRFVETHLRLHQQQPDLKVGGLGLTIAATSGQSISRFMNWYENSGQQFQYEQLLNGLPPDWKHFYTSNLSLKTELLRRYPFDEGFTAAVMEDIELGYRIQRRHGLELAFLPEALAHHLHPISFAQACKRFFKAGFSAHRFCEVWPELESVPPNSWRRMAHRMLWRSSWALSLASFFTAWLTKIYCPNRLILFLLGMHYRMGYLTRASRQEPNA